MHSERGAEQRTKGLRPGALHLTSACGTMRFGRSAGPGAPERRSGGPDRRLPTPRCPVNTRTRGAEFSVIAGDDVAHREMPEPHTVLRGTAQRGRAVFFISRYLGFFRRIPTRNQITSKWYIYHLDKPHQPRLSAWRRQAARRGPVAAAVPPGATRPSARAGVVAAACDSVACPGKCTKELE